MTNPYEPPKAPTSGCPESDQTSPSKPERMRTSAYGIASLVFALIPCCLGIGGLVAIALGVKALRQIKTEPHKYSGVGLAKAGIGIGALAVLALLAFAAFMGNRYAELEPIAETFTRHMIAGEFERAREFFIPEFRDQPDSAEQLLAIHEQVDMEKWGELQELAWDWNMQSSGHETAVGFEIMCTNGTTTMKAVFRKEGGQWLIVRCTFTPLRPIDAAPVKSR